MDKNHSDWENERLREIRKRVGEKRVRELGEEEFVRRAKKYELYPIANITNDYRHSCGAVSSVSIEHGGIAYLQCLGCGSSQYAFSWKDGEEVAELVDKNFLRRDGVKTEENLCKV